MRFIRVLHTGSLSLVFSLSMIGLSGGCGDDKAADKTVTKEDPKVVEDRIKNIESAYKANPPSKQGGKSAEKKP
jgi:hypothetical protein